MWTTLIFLSLVGGSLGIEWTNLREFEGIFLQYYKAAYNIINTSEETVLSIKENATIFIEEFSRDHFESNETQNNQNCSRIFDRFGNWKVIFYKRLKRSEMPITFLLTLLKVKLSNLRKTISMYQHLADSKYWSCEMAKKSCAESVNRWLEEVLPNVSCRLTPHCRSHERTKRKAFTCSQYEHTCSDGKCINREWLCDGEFDCEDRSDELIGCVQLCTRGFRCVNTLRCVNQSLICNGENDCGDNSDEENCQQMRTFSQDDSDLSQMEVCSIEMGQFECGNSKCIGLDKVCDGTRNCADGSDEGFLCGRGICPEECTRTGGICFHGPVGPICLPECPLGTYETPRGCETQLYPSRKTVMELLEDLPSLTLRYAARYAAFKMRTLQAFSKRLTETLKCYRNSYVSRN